MRLLHDEFKAMGCLGRGTREPPGDVNNLMHCLQISGFTRSRLKAGSFSLLVRVSRDKMDITQETSGNGYLEKS